MRLIITILVLVTGLLSGYILGLDQGTGPTLPPVVEVVIIQPPITPPVDPITLLIAEYARETGLEPGLLAAVIQKESGGDSLAVNPLDPSYGLGQVMPYWWRYVFIDECGSEATPVTLLDPRVNVCYTAYILSHFVEKYGYSRGIDAYNNGRGSDLGYSASVLTLMGG